MTLKTIIQGFINFLMAIPIIIIAAVIFLPIIIYTIISVGIQKRKDRSELKELLKINNGRIYFIHAYYNRYNLSEVISEAYEGISCIKIEKGYTQDLLTRYLVKDCRNRRYPRLVKIENKSLIHKAHYNTFKHLYKRNNNIDAFVELIGRSIHNLKHLKQ